MTNTWEPKGKKGFTSIPPLGVRRENQHVRKANVSRLGTGLEKAALGTAESSDLLSVALVYSVAKRFVLLTFFPRDIAFLPRRGG